VRRVILVLTVSMGLMVGAATASSMHSSSGAASSDRGAFFPSREPSFQIDGALAATAPADPSVNLDAVVNPMFYDRPLMLRQYGYGVLATFLAGSLGFYIGNAFEGAIFGGNSQKGYLSFTGIRYDHKRGPFWGGGAGLFVGSSLAVFFVGDMDEEQGSVLWTMAGGALTSAAALALADVAGVQEKRGMLAFVPLLALPPVGAVGGYHLSRWMNDKKRHRITEGGASAALVPGPVLHAPRFGFAPSAEGTVMRLDALNLTF
jgi:hypothetical protein